MSIHYVSTKYCDQLTARLKKQIDQKDLIDTKEMYYQSEVLAEIHNKTGTLTIQIFSTDYLKYHFLNYGLQAFAEPTIIKNIYQEWITEVASKYPSFFGGWIRKYTIIFKINGEVAF